jgi:hypothetical protein
VGRLAFLGAIVVLLAIVSVFRRARWWIIVGTALFGVALVLAGVLDNPWLVLVALPGMPSVLFSGGFHLNANPPRRGEKDIDEPHQRPRYRGRRHNRSGHKGRGSGKRRAAGSAHH